MARRLFLKIPGDTNELSPNARLHWRTEAGLVRKWRQAARLALLSARDQRCPFFALRVRITFTLFRGRLLDPDNAAGSKALKAIVDSLKGFCFPDDKASCVEYGPVAQVSGSHYRLFPALEVLVEEMPVESPTAGQGADPAPNASTRP